MKEKVLSYIDENKYLLIVITSLVILFVISIVSSIYLYQNKTIDCVESVVAHEVASLDEIEYENIEEDDAEYIYIDIKGAVVNPGVYYLDATTIVNDAIIAAGGFESDAVIDNINLSKIITSEMVIYVFSENEYEEEVTLVLTDAAESSSVLKSEEVYITEEVEEKISIIDSTTVLESSSASSSESSSLVNLNTASKEELLTLAGIGETKADAIIAYREETLFASIEELTNVSGIGDSTFESIKDFITV